MRLLFMLISGGLAAGVAFHMYDGSPIDVYLAYLIGCVIGDAAVRKEAVTSEQ